MRELPIANFMQYLAGFGIAVVVRLLGLQGAEDLERSARELRIDEGVLQRDDQAVAPEWGDEPWESGGRQENQVIRALNRQPKRSHVLQPLAKETVKFLVAGLDLDHVLQPVRHRLGMVLTFGSARRSQSATKNAGRRLSTHSGGSNAMTRSVQGHLEAQPSIGVHRLRVRRENCHSAAEIAAAVGGTKLLVRLGPIRRDPPSTQMLPDLPRRYRRNRSGARSRAGT